MKKDSGFRIQDSGVAPGFSPAPSAGADKGEADIAAAKPANIAPDTKGAPPAKGDVGAGLALPRKDDASIAPTGRADGREGAGQLPLIPDEWRNVVEELLTTGSTAEDVVEAVIGQGGPEVSVGAVLGHFRAHPGLQIQRVKQTLAGAAELRDALGNPQADHALVELANAALLVGYQGLTRKSGSITIKDAEVIRLARENLKLRRRVLRLKEVSVKRANDLHWKKLRYEDVKYDTALEKLNQLRHALHSLMAEGKLESGTLEKIREIYGIIRQPFIPPEGESPKPQEQ